VSNSPQHGPSGYPEQRLEGLRRHAAERRQATLERLRTAIEVLEARGEAITVHTIRAESHLDYKSYARNPEALKLFQEHSTFLAARRKEARRKRRKRSEEEGSQAQDPLLNYKRPQLVARLRQAMHHREEIEGQYRQLLEDRLQADLKLRHLEAELARYQSFLGHLRGQVQQEEHGGKTWPFEDK
jgi:hypothetical protein